MKEKIQRYLQDKEDITTLAKEIFLYIKRNYIGLLAFGKYSAYDGFQIKHGKFSIKHLDIGYDIYDYSWFRIPLKHIYEGTWKEYIRCQEQKRINKLNQEETEEAARTKEKELQLLKELKAKYESEESKER